MALIGGHRLPSKFSDYLVRDRKKLLCGYEVPPTLLTHRRIREKPGLVLMLFT